MVHREVWSFGTTFFSVLGRRLAEVLRVRAPAQVCGVVFSVSGRLAEAFGSRMTQVRFEYLLIRLQLDLV